LAQSNWTYYSLTGRPYLIQLYHGDESGHLLVFVNGDIINLAFSQTDDYTYNFYIERQLLELVIQENNGDYDYIVTPQPMPPIENNERTFDKHFWIPLIFLLLILNLAFFLIKT